MLKVHTALVCDDVRNEANGKQIIIGVYNSDMRMDNFPANVLLTFWLQVGPITEDNAVIDFRCTLSGKVITHGAVNFPVQSNHPKNGIAIGPFPIILEKPGTLRFEVKLPNSVKWIKAIDLPIISTPVPLSLP